MKNLFKITLLLLICFQFALVPSAYYRQTEKMGCVAEKVQSAVAEYRKEVDVRSCNIPKQEMLDFFWLDSITKIYGGLLNGYSYYSANNVVERLIIEYSFDQQSTIDIQKKYNLMASEIVSNIDHTMTDIDKLFYLHNYLVVTSQYDMVAYNNPNDVNNKFSFYLYGPLYYRKAVCQG